MKSLLLCKMALIKEQTLVYNPYSTRGRTAETRGCWEWAGQSALRQEKQQAFGSVRDSVSINQGEHWQRRMSSFGLHMCVH